MIVQKFLMCFHFSYVVCKKNFVDRSVFKTKKSEEKGEENAQPENDGDQQQTTDRKSQKTKKESKQQEKA